MALTLVQCVHYCLTRPAVASVLAGYDTPEHVEQAAAYETAADMESDLHDSLFSEMAYGESHAGPGLFRLARGFFSGRFKSNEPEKAEEVLDMPAKKGYGGMITRKEKY